MRDWLCKLLCGKWCDIQLTETWKKTWKVAYKIGYEDGKAGREPMPPPPTRGCKVESGEQVFPLLLKEIQELLHIGLRPVGVPNEIIGDIMGAYLLIPTRGSKWWQIDDSKWDGSYIPLILYKGNRACILVCYGKEELWQRELADKLTEILGMDVTARGD